MSILNDKATYLLKYVLSKLIKIYIIKNINKHLAGFDPPTSNISILVYNDLISRYEIDCLHNKLKS